MKVHQLLSAAGPHDAVTVQARTYRRLMADWGIGGEIYAGVADPGLDGEVRPAARLAAEAAPGDALLIHYSAHSRQVRAALELPQRKLFVYHNITPARYLWSYQPLIATLCAIGRDELPHFAARVDAAAAVSAYNARELEQAGFRDVAVIPNLLDPARLEPGAAGPSPWRDGRRNVLFVGRVSPHKRHDELIKAFALYQRHREPDSRLILAGAPLAPSYRAALEELAARLGARDVVLAGPLPQAELNAAYADAHAFCCLSEHEGFCIPLLEAMHFGLPVVAYRAGGVPEVAGDAAVLLDAKPLPVVAEALHLAITDEGLREELRARGRRRLERFGFEATAARLQAWLEAAIGGGEN